MGSLFHFLDNSESILLMYLAGELPAEDRAEVEQMLQADASLRAELERLRAAHEQIAAGLARLDVGSAAASGAASARRFGRAVDRWRAAQVAQARQPVAPQRRGLRVPTWSYPLAAAAALVVGYLVWWGNQPFLIKHPDNGRLVDVRQQRNGGMFNTDDPRVQQRFERLSYPFKQDPEALAMSDGPDLGDLLREITTEDDASSRSQQPPPPPQ